MNNSLPEISSLSFEAAMSELEMLVSKLERGDVSLEDSIKLYERGEGLKAHCEKQLRGAELKIEKIVLNAKGEVQSTQIVDKI